MRKGWILAGGLLVLSTGCVQRALTIKTEPPGAKVYVNDALKGESPVTYDFEWYGWHRLTIRKEGFQRLDDHKQLRAPLYLWIPLDLVMELLPFPIRDTRTWSYTLIPAPESVAPSPPELLAPSTPASTEGGPGPAPEPTDEPR